MVVKNSDEHKDTHSEAVKLCIWMFWYQLSKSLLEALYLQALILAKCGSYVNIKIILSDRYSFFTPFQGKFFKGIWHQLTCLSNLGVRPLHHANFTRIIYYNWRHRTVNEIESKHYKIVWISKLQSFTYEFENLLQKSLCSSNLYKVVKESVTK